MLKHRYIRSLTLVVAFIWAIGYGCSLWGVGWFVVIVVLFVGITTWGAFDIRQGYFAPVDYKGRGNTKAQISLTFDDGPTPFTSQILALLDRYDVKATFFCIGKQMEKHPDIARLIIEKGHSIGNHSYTHAKNIAFFGLQAVLDEIQFTDKAIKDITGTETKMYRPPFGVTNPNIAKACKLQQKTIIGWSIRSLDTVIQDENRILKRIIPRLKGGDILLLHDTSERTVSVLEQLLIQIQDKNIEPIPVDRLIKIE